MAVRALIDLQPPHLYPLPAVGIKGKVGADYMPGKVKYRVHLIYILAVVEEDEMMSNYKAPCAG